MHPSDRHLTKQGLSCPKSLVGHGIRLVITSVLLLISAATGPLATLTAQCVPTWLPGDLPGTNGTVLATVLWDQDGPGPLPPKTVIGGGFTRVGSVQTSNIAVYDPTSGSWSTLGSGLSHSTSGAAVYALAVLPNGDLVAAGVFNTAGGIGANNIARWDGSQWHPLASGIVGTWVNALTTRANGELVAGGAFAVAGGVGANNIASWNGTSWTALGAGTNSFVQALVNLPNGDLVAGGGFNTAGGITVNRIARWDGTTWSPLGTGMGATSWTPDVYALAVLTNGDLIAGGQFTSAGGIAASRIARWDGTAWSPLGSGMGSLPGIIVYALAVLPNGDLIAGGGFSTAGGIGAARIARWNGSSWSALGSGMQSQDVRALLPMPNGDVIAGGAFVTAGGLSAQRLARWNGTSWWPMAGGLNSNAAAIGRLANGDFVVGGNFTAAGTLVASHIARRSGNGWLPLGAGMNGDVSAIVTLPNGDLVAGGSFTTAGGLAANRVARWDGATWWPLGSGLGGFAVQALATLPNGDLVAGGSFTTAGGSPALRVARWDGANWSPIGAGLNNTVFALTCLPNGDLVAGGDFTTAGGSSANRIARWDGTTWSTYGTGMTASVLALGTMANGDLVAGGVFPSRIVRWNGTSWSALLPNLSASVRAFTNLPNGDLVATGDFTAAGTTSASYVARWNGTSWAPLGYGLDGSGLAIATDPSGEVVVVGAFTTAGGAVNPSTNFARYATTCAASANSYGNGCAGSGGPLALVATDLPWLGSSYRGTASGFAVGSLAFDLLGWSAAATPLPLLHPTGGPGCDLLVNPDATQLLLPVAGAVTTQLSIPNDLALAGLTLRNQILQVELDASLNITALTSTNAVALTIGVW